MGNMLYNGVELPDIETVWTDKETYPNAMIVFSTGSVAAELYLGAFDFADHDTYGPCVYFDYSTVERRTYRLYQGDAEWSYFSSSASGGVGTSGRYPAWVSHDIYYYDGTLAISASTPVDPNAPTTAGMPTDIFSAFMLGQRLRPGLMGVGEPPVASMYFYPSVVLPALPEWDVESYPYAYLYNLTNNKHTVFACLDKPLLYKDEYDFEVIIEGATETIIFSECFLVEKKTSGVTYKYTKGANTFEGPMEYHAPVVDTVLFSSASSKQDINFGKAEPLWTNTSLVKGDGTVYLSASTPVPAGNGMVAYKGVRLPKLPEWDREKYPYAFMIYNNHYWEHLGGTIEEYRVMFSEIMPRSNGEKLEFDADSEIVSWEYVIAAPPSYNVVLMEWTYSHATVYKKGANLIHPIWSNTNVLNQDGSLYLAATDSIPIYE